MGALFDRLKVWADEENLTDEDLNAEIDNILDNLTPEFISGFSANVTQMQTQTSPGGVGTESLATSTSDEIERLRYMISQVIGGTYWYSAVPASLTAINATLTGLSVNVNPRNGVVSGAIDASNQPMFLLPTGSALTATLKATATAINYWVNGSTFTVSADVVSANLTLAPGSNNTALASGNYDKNDTDITIGTVGSNISALVGSIGAFKVGSEYFLAYVAASTKLTRCLRGIFFSNTGASFPAAAISNGATITMMKLAWHYLKNDGTLGVSYTNPVFSGTEPSSPASGDYWFDLSSQTWKRYDGANYVTSDSILIGFSMSDGTGCVAARSIDLVKSYLDTCNVNPRLFDIDNYITFGKGFEISVYGTTIKSDIGNLSWNLPNSLPAGEAEANDIWYYLYVKDTGETVITSIAPIFMENLKGYYHPAKPWRCVGKAYNATSADAIQHDVVSLIAHNYTTGTDMTTTAVASPGDLIATTKIKCKGGSVLVGLVPKKGANNVNDGMRTSITTNGAGAGGWVWSIFRDGVEIAAWNNYQTRGAAFEDFITGSFITVDDPGAGEHEYKFYAWGNSAINTEAVVVDNTRLVAVEFGAAL